MKRPCSLNIPILLYSTGLVVEAGGLGFGRAKIPACIVEASRYVERDTFIADAQMTRLNVCHFCVSNS